MWYPPIEPYASGHLAVDAGQMLYWETSGNPNGVPVLFLHGGPGGGCSVNDRRYFDPARYRIVLFDQRGCGRSTPSGAITTNTTAHLIDDIEMLRIRLNIDQWVLFGGSWGSTLALAYAERFPLRVSAMVLRGVFTARASELNWLYRGGAAQIFPDAWARFARFIPPQERDDLIAAYFTRLTCGETDIETAAAREWCLWEDTLSTLLPSPAPFDDANQLPLARIEAHYMLHRAFIEEGQLLAHASRLRGIPGIIVQGRYDMVTPAVTAWQLHQAWPGSSLRLIPDAGHAASEAGIRRALIAATDALPAILHGSD